MNPLIGIGAFVGLLIVIGICVTILNQLKDVKFKNPDWTKHNAHKFSNISEDKSRIFIRSGIIMYSQDIWLLEKDTLFKTRHELESDHWWDGSANWEVKDVVIKNKIPLNAVNSMSIAKPRKSLVMGIHGWLTVAFADSEGTLVEETINFKPVAWQAATLIYFRFCEVNNLNANISDDENAGEYPYPYHKRFNPKGSSVI